MKINFDNSYARLSSRFYAEVRPTRVREPHIVQVNHGLAELLGIDPAGLDSAEGAQVLGGNVVPEGATPIALAYAGHQFGGFVPQLGDGRAILLGEVVGTDGVRRDIQLKGAGPTPFSRQGDGRAALGPVLREYIVSEAMAAMNIPTTRALAAVTTGETVIREELLPGAVLTRVAASHMRVGTFQFFAARDDGAALSALTAYALARHYPEGAQSERGRPDHAVRLLAHVIDAHAFLIAQWLGVGFIHGVMNTDNMSISGETIDYGPCAFLDDYDPMKKFSAIDRGGRYAFGNQARVAQWNLARFAETLLPLIDDNDEEAARLATEQLHRFPVVFDAAFGRVMRAKLGLVRHGPNDGALIADLLERLAANQVDYTIFFRGLCSAAQDTSSDHEVAALFQQPGAFHSWAEAWRTRVQGEERTPSARAEAMRQVNPAFIPRNHRIEQAITAGRAGDFQPFFDLVAVLRRPFEEQPAFAHLAEPPLSDERVRQTFCGT